MGCFHENVVSQSFSQISLNRKRNENKVTTIVID